MTTGSDEDEDSSEEEEDEDEDMSGDAESEYVASNDKKPSGEDAAAKRKHLRINVEPIVLAPSPDELDGPIAYAKHHRSFSHKIKVFLFIFGIKFYFLKNVDGEETLNRWIGQAHIWLGAIALAFAVLAFVILLRRRRNRHPGFIEVLQKLF